MRNQRTFTAVTGLIFACLFVVHIARIVFEGPTPLRDPLFVGVTVIVLGAASWSALLLLRRPS